MIRLVRSEMQKLWTIRSTAVLLALTARGTAGMPATGAGPSADGDADVVMPAHEVRSRGPPTSSVRLARSTAEVPVLSIRPAVHEQSPQCRNAAGRARARDA